MLHHPYQAPIPRSTKPFIFLLLISLAIPLVLSIVGWAQEIKVRDYDWIVEIETQELTGYLDYPGSNLKPIIQARITYKEGDAVSSENKASKQVLYQDFWYKGCNPVGCRRYHTYNIPPGDGIAIRVKHKNNSVAVGETCACANAIIRVLLDAYMNSNPVISVLVPDSTFSSIVADLAHENFYQQADAPPDVPQYASIILYLTSEPSGANQTMFYAGKTTD